MWRDVQILSRSLNIINTQGGLTVPPRNKSTYLPTGAISDTWSLTLFFFGVYLWTFGTIWKNWTNQCLVPCGRVSILKAPYWNVKTIAIRSLKL
jgi:hypothetical protein